MKKFLPSFAILILFILACIAIGCIENMTGVKCLIYLIIWSMVAFLQGFTIASKINRD